MKKLIPAIALCAAMTAANISSAASVTLDVEVTSITTVSSCAVQGGNDESLNPCPNYDFPPSPSGARYPGTIELNIDLNDESNSSYAASFEVDGSTITISNYQDILIQSITEDGVGYIASVYYDFVFGRTFQFDGTRGRLIESGEILTPSFEITEEVAREWGIEFIPYGSDTSTVMTISLWGSYETTHEFVVVESAPIPLPAGLPLLAAGLVSLGVLRKRKTR